MKTQNLNKYRKITYWIATIWVALGMLSTGIGQLLKIQSGAGSVEMLQHLNYPLYLLNILGFFKILGVIVILVPKVRLAKEWAYAGFFFLLIGAIASHAYMKDSIYQMFPAILLLLLTLVSWHLRPENKTLVQFKKKQFNL